MKRCGGSPISRRPYWSKDLVAAPPDVDAPPLLVDPWVFKGVLKPTLEGPQVDETWMRVVL